MFSVYKFSFLSACLIIMVFGLFGNAYAANIRYYDAGKKSGFENSVIVLEGKIERQDYVKFLRIIENHQDTFVVYLKSPGGLIQPSLKIGRKIREKKLVTFTDDLCASACGLIWLAGQSKFLTPGAKLGFHAASSTTDGSVAAVGNALVGAYVNELGYSTNIVKYVTSASPDGMEFLSHREAQLLGLQLTILNSANMLADYFPNNMPAHADGNKIGPQEGICTIAGENNNFKGEKCTLVITEDVTTGLKVETYRLHSGTEFVVQKIKQKKPRINGYWTEETHHSRFGICYPILEENSTFCIKMAVYISPKPAKPPDGLVRRITGFNGKCRLEIVSGFFPCDSKVILTELRNGRAFFAFTKNKDVFSLSGGKDRQPNLENHYLSIDTIRIMKGGKIKAEDSGMEGECHTKLNKEATIFYEIKCEVYNRAKGSIYKFYLEEISGFEKKEFGSASTRSEPVKNDADKTNQLIRNFEKPEDGSGMKRWYFAGYQNIDFWGGDIYSKGVRADNIKQCIQQCGDEVSCKVFTYNAKFKRCFTKRSYSFVVKTPETISGVIFNSIPQSDQLPAPPNIVAEFIAYSGKEYKGIWSPFVQPTVKISTIDKCLRYCRKNLNCNYVTFNPNKLGKEICKIRTKYNSGMKSKLRATSYKKISEKIMPNAAIIELGITR